MKAKLISLFTLSLIFMIAFSACQAQPTIQPAATQPVDVQQPASNPTASTPVDITFWHQYDKKNAAMMDILVSEFNASHPNIKVKAVVQPSYDEYKTLLQASILSGTSPDLAAVDLIWVPQYIQDDALQSLDDFIKSDSQFNINDFYTLLSNYDMKDGKRYGLPFDTNNIALVWNKDLFTAAGLDPEVPPKTWEELQTMAEKCSNPDKNIVGFEIYDNPPNEGITWNFQYLLWQAGGEFLNADNTAAAFNSPAGLKALTFISAMNQGKGSVPGSKGTFGDGLACMGVDGTWLFGYRSSAPFAWDVAPLPIPEGGQPATNTGGEHLMMFKSSPNQAAVWEFMKYLTSTSIQKRWAMETGMLPVVKSVGEDQAYLDWQTVAEPRMKGFLEQLPYAHTRPAIPLYTQVSDAFAAEIQKAYLGIATPAEALTAAEAAVNQVLSQGK